ncbi:hypothetical protein BCR43DRAFT_497346 [Syncephalastrum racemosum]|uniref:Uncharacterized protein n=1 Tax=Syncephalastrum racemosum TaxID=13706 RepID=A0A1X2H1Z4_SYNRA|nr:hypothetical protein BCR43DRAFT_497346 [Syncephalastrum racemosum]
MTPSVNTADDFYGDHVHPWSEIYELVSSNQVHLIRRNREGQQKYRQWTAETLEKYGTIENYLLSEKLQPLARQQEDTAGKDADRPRVLVLPNDFPYSTAPGIEHHLIWSQTPLKEDYVRDILESHFGSSKWEWVYFVNPVETQSIRRLPHVHVFMRPRQSDKQ